MNVLVYLVPLALGLGLIGLFGFLWALRNGQYSDAEGAALRICRTTTWRRSVDVVVTGLVPVTPFGKAWCPPERDGRDKPGHDRH